MSDQLEPAPTQTAELTVQVPVSLIERLYAGEDVVDALHDLVPHQDSQPRPSARPCTCPPPATHLGEGPDQDCPKHGDRFHVAVPPSIADMAPGTTFTAELTRYPGRPLHFSRDHGPYVIGEGFNYVSAEVDPSTIRDITPPRAD